MKKREHGILFMPEMVSGIISGKKEMTRRIIKPQPDDDGLHNHTLFPMSLQSDMQGWWGTVDETGEHKEFNFPYGDIGDLLFVRETHFGYGRWVKDGHTKKGVTKWKFKALNNEVRYLDNQPEKFWKSRNKKYPDAPAWYKRNSLFMPKYASRLWLKITGIKVERLQDISEKDAISEGIESTVFENAKTTVYKNYMDASHAHEDPRKSFQTLWISINGVDSWKNNPYIWCLNFKVLSKTGKP